MLYEFIKIKDAYIKYGIDVYSNGLFLCNSKDDGLANLDATRQTADTENNDEAVMLNRERKHFPYNITKIGHVLFSVSCTLTYTAYR